MATKDYSPKRTGNEASHAGKREAFKSAKAERAPLANHILNVFEKRKVPDNDDAGSFYEGAEPDVKPKKFKK
jgi:hypothetical protein